MDSRAAKFNRMRAAINLERPDRMPFSGDWGNIEYRKDVYHLGEPELVSEMGQVVVSEDGKRRYTRDGGVWAVGDSEQYKDYEDVLAVDPEQFEVEQVRPAMLDEMAQLYAERARTCFPLPWHYGTLVTRAVLAFGWEPFLMAAAVDPQRLGKILDRFGAASLSVAQGWAQTEGVELIVIHDDIAGTRGILMRPAWYRQYVFPWYRRIFAAIQEKGRKVLYISDGNVLQVLDDIMETGADGLYIESTSMDPEVVMRRGGRDKLYMVKSNSRNTDFGTAEDIRAELEKLRALHTQYPGIMIYRGGGQLRPENREAFARYYHELLVYE
jgi:hypothetical protein